MTEEIKLYTDETTESYVVFGEGEHDAITNPSHYLSSRGLEVEEMLRSYYKVKILKYLLHEREKNGLEDSKKARQYFDWLIDLEETHDTYQKLQQPQ